MNQADGWHEVMDRLYVLQLMLHRAVDKHVQVEGDDGMGDLVLDIDDAITRAYLLAGQRHEAAARAEKGGVTNG